MFTVIQGSDNIASRLVLTTPFRIPTSCGHEQATFGRQSGSVDSCLCRNDTRVKKSGRVVGRKKSSDISFERWL